MISKYDGRCRYCKQATHAGVDEYDVETRQSYHVACQSQSQLLPIAEQHELAERLGFRHYTWDELLQRMNPHECWDFCEHYMNDEQGDK